MSEPSRADQSGAPPSAQRPDDPRRDAPGQRIDARAGGTDAGGPRDNRARFFTREEVRALARRSDLVGAWLVLHAWGTIALALLLFRFWPNPVTFLFAVLVIGSRQLGLAILMHDAAHRALFRSGWMNEFAGRWLCGAPILADMDAYRHYHLVHHRLTQTEGDPDLVLSRPFPTTRASLVRKFLRDLTGQTGIKQLVRQIALAFRLAGDPDAIGEANRQAQSFKSTGLTRPALANLALFAVFALVGQGWWWLALWLLPLLTWFQLVLRLRNLGEHAATEFSDDPLRNVRTTRAGPLARLFIAPYWVNFHLEHHLVMHVPCWRLARMHRMMLDKGWGQEMRLARSYWQVLKEVGWSRLEAAAARV